MYWRRYGVWLVWVGVAVFGAFANAAIAVELELSSSEALSSQAESNDGEARALYESMLTTLGELKSLRYVSEYRWESEGEERENCRYSVWLKKPNLFRVEVVTDETSQGDGILVGDGRTAWTFWSKGRPQWDLIPEDATTYKKTFMRSYMKSSAGLGKHSIGHKMVYLEDQMGIPIVDPSLFHGHKVPLYGYVDSVRGLGRKRVHSEWCEGIEVSLMKGQRRWFLWISERDHLPRQLREVTRFDDQTIETTEEWSSLAVNEEIPNARFEWSPPEGWSEWSRPAPESFLLKPGTRAPDFKLMTTSGDPVRISDFRGKVVWFYMWRLG